MYFGSAVNLLQAIGTDRGVQTLVSQTRDPDVGNEWIVAAQSADGQLYRSRHSNLLLAVVMLERMLKGTTEPAASRI